MRQLLGRIERNTQDIAYAYLQVYQLAPNENEQNKVLALIQDKKAENVELLLTMQNQIDQALTQI